MIWRNLGKLYAYDNNKMSKSLPVSNGFICVLPWGNCPLVALTQENPRIDHMIMSLSGQTLKRGKKYKERRRYKTMCCWLICEFETWDGGKWDWRKRQKLDLKGPWSLFKGVGVLEREIPGNNSVKEEPGSGCSLEKPEGCVEDRLWPIAGLERVRFEVPVCPVRAMGSDKGVCIILLSRSRRN